LGALQNHFTLDGMEVIAKPVIINVDLATIKLRKITTKGHALCTVNGVENVLISKRNYNNFINGTRCTVYCTIEDSSELFRGKMYKTLRMLRFD
jgi:hypothetical protein